LRLGLIGLALEHQKIPALGLDSIVASASSDNHFGPACHINTRLRGTVQACTDSLLSIDPAIESPLPFLRRDASNP